MKMIKNAGILAFAGCTLINTSLAMAADDSGFYLGGNVGQSVSHLDESGMTNRVSGPGLAITSVTRDNRDIGYKLYGGYQANKYLSLESGWFDLGRFNFTSTTTPAGSLLGNIKVRGVNLDALIRLPLTDQFSVFGRGGMTYAQTRDSFSTTGALALPANASPKKWAWNPKYGVGLDYNLTRAFGIRAEAERYRINDATGSKGNIDLFSLGMTYRFGTEKPAPAPVAVVEPEPVVPEPVVVTPPPAPVKTVFASDSSANSLFGFNRSTLRNEGKRALDKFVEGLKGASFETMVVTGYTDRIGTDEYNQKLSERRANAVRDYLVKFGGIPADKITARGAGESNPVTKREDCAGKSGNPLITCLAPDRRVEVEVTATRTSE
ncbi:OmpA family protein [Mariprofundus ferrooxydans]|uniref:OmpA family protein n=1 Tax=Mariprofundus ferrooxydans TaxID=314344 RepID=UPI00143148B4|nr:OmpA family protein [Mariprofundus ferrooxydans]